MSEVDSQSMEIHCDSVAVTRGDSEVLSLKGQKIIFSPKALSVLLGPNGSGKTTLLRCLAGMIPLDSGKIEIRKSNHTRDISTLKPKERAEMIFWIPERVVFPFSFSALDVVLMSRFPQHKGSPQEIDYDFSHQALKRVGIFSQQIVENMSSGEQRKVMIAMAFSSTCPIILIDEPLANLDIGASWDILWQLQKLARGGKTVITSIHQWPHGGCVGDFIALLKDGRLLGAGLRNEILTQNQVAMAFDSQCAQVNMPSLFTNEGEVLLPFRNDSQ